MSTDLGTLNAAMRFARPTNNRIRINGAARFWRAYRLYRFTPFVVGNTNDGNFSNIGMAENRAFYFGGIDIFAAGDDHVLHPVVE